MNDEINLDIDPVIESVIVKKVGLVLREAREEKKISPDRIKRELKMRPLLLSAIEEGRYKDLPDVTTVAALVKSYANYLGLNGTVLAQDYRSEMQGLETKVEIDFPEMLPNTFKISRMAMIASLFLVTAAALIGWSHYMRKDPFITQDNWIGLLDDPILGGMGQGAVSEESGEATTEVHSVYYNFLLPAQEVKIDLPKHMFLIAQDEASWVEVKNKNKKVIFSAILNKGQSYQIPDQKGLLLKTGNGAALRLKVGEKHHDIFPKKARIIKNFSLERDNLEKIIKN